MFNIDSDLIANSPAQKRAISYANTILSLFSEVMSTKKPADRVIANYFREQKKHGSKDRRIIRETLFGLFRWWGWLRKPSLCSETDLNLNTQTLELLLCVAVLEKHTWTPTINAWAELCDFQIQKLESIALLESELERIQHIFPEQVFELTELLPDVFWSQCSLSESQQHQLALSMLSRPPIWARAQFETTESVISALSSDGIEVAQSTFFEDALSLGTKSINLPQVKPYQEGKLEIQDIASQVIGNICSPKADQNWWDSCSGAGGKSLQLASLMSRDNVQVTGQIVSSDIRKSVLEELKKRSNRAGIQTIKTQYWNDEVIPVQYDYFDGVLVDAPCTCTGTWRRNPDMRWTDNLDNVEETATLQLDILNSSSLAVKSGGVLVYATCSLLEKENQQVIEAFLSTHPEFRLQELKHPFTAETHDYLTIWPFEANSDGMFVAKMVKD